MDANQQIVDSKRVIYRFAAQIIEVSDIDNCCLATINRHLEDASIEEAQGAGLDQVARPSRLSSGLGNTPPA